MQVLSPEEQQEFDDGAEMIRTTLEGSPPGIQTDKQITEEFMLFLKWERSTRDTIDFKKIYVDMADDLVAGLLLSQIVYWYMLPDKDGQSKLRVFRNGEWWIAKGRKDWYEEVRITAYQFDRASAILVNLGMLAKDCFRFNGMRTVHVRLVKPQFMHLWRAAIKKQDVCGLGESERPAPVLDKVQDRNRGKCKTLNRDYYRDHFRDYYYIAPRNSRAIVRSHSRPLTSRYSASGFRGSLGGAAARSRRGVPVLRGVAASQDPVPAHPRGRGRPARGAGVLG